MTESVCVANSVLLVQNERDVLIVHYSCSKCAPLNQALEEAVKLREDNVELTNLLSEERARMKEDRERFKQESERMQRRAATTEREKAELRDNLEEQTTQWRTRQERYERELTEMKAVLSSVREEIRMFRDQV